MKTTETYHKHQDFKKRAIEDLRVTGGKIKVSESVEKSISTGSFAHYLIAEYSINMGNDTIKLKNLIGYSKKSNVKSLEVVQHEYGRLFKYLKEEFEKYNIEFD
jgi:hypothetical protein